MSVEWRLIETAPKEGRGKGIFTGTRGPEILLAQKGGHITIGFWNGRSWDDGDWHDDMGEFDYWMPLPELPTS